MKRLILLSTVLLFVSNLFAQDAGNNRSHGDPKLYRTMEEFSNRSGYRAQGDTMYREILLMFDKNILKFPGAYRTPEVTVLPLMDTNGIEVIKELKNSFLTVKNMQYFVFPQGDSVDLEGFIELSAIDADRYIKGDVTYIPIWRYAYKGEWGFVFRLNLLPGFEDVHPDYYVFLKSSYCYNMLPNKVNIPKIKPKKQTICVDTTLLLEDGLYVDKIVIKDCDTVSRELVCNYFDDMWYDTVGRFEEKWQRRNCVVSMVSKREIYPKIDLTKSYPTDYPAPRYNLPAPPKKHRKFVGLKIAGGVIVGVGVGVLTYAAIKWINDSNRPPAPQDPIYQGGHQEPDPEPDPDPDNPTYAGGHESPK